MILNHYPPVIKQIKDIQQIAKAEDIEFTKLNTSITEVIRNMFVFTADETGVKRFTQERRTKMLKDRLVDYTESIVKRATYTINGKGAYYPAYSNMSKTKISMNTVSNASEGRNAWRN